MDIDGLDDVPGTVSVWYGPVGSAEPWYARHEHVTHYAASPRKVAVLLAAATRADPWIMATLAATEDRDDLAAGLPPDARIAHKSGWVTGIRHGAAVVEGEGGCRYLLVVCTTTTLPDGAARALLARVAAWSFEQARA